MPKYATHMLRDELFDLSDLLERLNYVKDECLDAADAIKVKFPKLIVTDSNGDRLGYIEHDGGMFTFVPQVQP